MQSGNSRRSRWKWKQPINKKHKLPIKIKRNRQKRNYVTKPDLTTMKIQINNNNNNNMTFDPKTKDTTHWPNMSHHWSDSYWLYWQAKAENSWQLLDEFFLFFFFYGKLLDEFRLLCKLSGNCLLVSLYSTINIKWLFDNGLFLVSYFHLYGVYQKFIYFMKTS